MNCPLVVRHWELENEAKRDKYNHQRELDLKDLKFCWIDKPDTPEFLYKIPILSNSIIDIAVPNVALLSLEDIKRDECLAWVMETNVHEFSDDELEKIWDAVVNRVFWYLPARVRAEKLEKDMVDIQAGVCEIKAKIKKPSRRPSRSSLRLKGAKKEMVVLPKKQVKQTKFHVDESENDTEGIDGDDSGLYGR